MPNELFIGSHASLQAIPPVSELLSIDREIGHPYFRRAGIFNSQAWSRRLELPWVVSRVERPEGLSILDVGSGISSLPTYMHRHGARVVSAEPRPPSEIASAPYTRIRAALPSLPFRDKSFDIVLCVSVLEHLSSPLSEVFAELARVARSRVLMTFDLAFGPLAKVGLSRIELRALEKMAGVAATFPPDLLRPTTEERLFTGPHVGVCLLAVDVGSATPRVSLGFAERAFIRVHRTLQKLFGLASTLVESTRTHEPS